MAQTPTHTMATVRDFAANFTALMRTEGAVAAAEFAQMRENFRRAGLWLALGMAGGFYALAVLIVLAIFVLVWFGVPVLPALAAVFVVLALAAALMVRHGLAIARRCDLNFTALRSELGKTVDVVLRKTPDVG